MDFILQPLSLLVILSILLFISEITEYGILAVISSIAFVLVLYFLKHINFVLEVFQHPIYILIYFLTGFIFLPMFVYFYGRTNLKNSFKPEKHDIDTFLALKKEELIGNCFRWFFLWPFKLINLFFGEVLKRAFTSLYSLLSNSFNRILKYAILK